MIHIEAVIIAGRQLIFCNYT